MLGEFFLDTNILVYCFDHSDQRKSHRANELVRMGLETKQGTVSWQVVQEFINVALHRFEVPMTVHQAEDYLLTVLTPMCRVFPSPDLYREAILIHVETRFNFYDALIVASAIASNAKLLFSEDLQHGRRVRTVEIRNPFLE